MHEFVDKLVSPGESISANYDQNSEIELSEKEKNLEIH